MFDEVLAAIQATSVWCGVPVANLTRDHYRSAYKNGVHQTSEQVVRELGRWESLRNAAAAQEDYSTENAALVYKLKNQLKQVKREKELLLDQVGQMQTMVEFNSEVDDCLVLDLEYHPVISKTKRTAAAVAVLSDLHIEETVDPDSVGGVNSFDLCEAERRLERLFESIDWMVRHHRHAYRLDTLVLALIGDLISGYIHEELVEINSLSPTEAVVWLADRIIPGIDMLLKKTKLKEIIVPCCFGNHGRTTRRTHISTLHKNNLELFVYDAVRRAFKDDDRVDVQIAQGELLYVQIWNHTLRFTHGDCIKGGSGPLGPLAPAMRKILAWDKTRDADVTIMGHWHRYTALPNLVINGSLIGYGPYTQHIGALYEEPSQAFFLIDAERGKTFDAPLWVRELKDEERVA